MSTLFIQIPLFRIQRRSLFSPPFKHANSTSFHSSRLLCSASSSDSFSREESRWLREEQRWLREEQRWLRQESLWNSERESLLSEISALRLRIQQLEAEREYLNQNSVSETLSKIAFLLQSLKDSTSSPSGSIVAAEEGEKSTAGSFVETTADSSSAASSPKVVTVNEPRVVPSTSASDDEEYRKLHETKKEAGAVRRTLKRGSEGDEVQALQEALLKLGFYSGEEDMEYSSFDSGTESAVKTWQASLGAKEDGIMTSELLDILFGSNSTTSNQSENYDLLDGMNGAHEASVIEIAEREERIIKTQGSDQVEVYENRVFLLGENRWEEPSRLKVGNDKLAGSDKAQNSPERCMTCRGEGRLLCTECDGTGEPNLEPQFLEWVDEGAKCPYCEGLGYTICDVCEGKTPV